MIGEPEDGDASRVQFVRSAKNYMEFRTLQKLILYALLWPRDNRTISQLR